MLCGWMQGEEPHRKDDSLNTSSNEEKQQSQPLGSIPFPLTSLGLLLLTPHPPLLPPFPISADLLLHGENRIQDSHSTQHGWTARVSSQEFFQQTPQSATKVFYNEDSSRFLVA